MAEVAVDVAREEVVSAIMRASVERPALKEGGSINAPSSGGGRDESMSARSALPPMRRLATSDAAPEVVD